MFKYISYTDNVQVMLKSVIIIHSETESRIQYCVEVVPVLSTILST